MERKSYRKAFVFGLVFFVLAAGIIPTLNATTNVFREEVKSSEIDKEKLVDEALELSEMMNVNIIKLSPNGFTRRVRERISVAEFKDYSEKISTSESLDETFAVLQEYDIVPDYMDLDDFIQIYNNRLNFYKSKLSSYDELTCAFTWFILEVSTFCYNMWTPAVFWMGYADSGSIRTRCGDFSLDTRFDCILIVPIGINSITPILDLDGGSFIGFAAYLYCY